MDRLTIYFIKGTLIQPEINVRFGSIVLCKLFLITKILVDKITLNIRDSTLKGLQFWLADIFK